MLWAFQKLDIVMEGGQSYDTWLYTIYNIVLYYIIYTVYTALRKLKNSGREVPPKSGLFQNWERREGGFFLQKIIVRTCGETHSVIDSMLAFGSVPMPCKQKWYSWFIITITYSAAQNAPRNLCKKSLDKLYFTLKKWDLLWKTHGKIMENDPERLCEPWSKVICD